MATRNFGNTTQMGRGSAAGTASGAAAMKARQLVCAPFALPPSLLLKPSHEPYPPLPLFRPNALPSPAPPLNGYLLFMSLGVGGKAGCTCD